MPTKSWQNKNPKISAYVSQEVFDRFKTFQDKRGFTMSKAVTAILCDYFDIKQTTDGLPSGITLAQFQDVLKRLAELEQRVESQPVFQNAALMPGESQAIDGSSQLPQLSAEAQTVAVQEEYETPQLPFPESEPQQITSEPLLKESVASKPTLFTTAEDLALRLSCHPQSIKNFKSNNSTEQFIQWTTEKDPDDIPWNYQMKVFGRAMGFYPCCDLSSEQQQSLTQWFNKVAH